MISDSEARTAAKDMTTEQLQARLKFLTAQQAAQCSTTPSGCTIEDTDAHEADRAIEIQAIANELRSRGAPLSASHA